MIVNFNQINAFLVSSFKPIYLRFLTKELTFTFEHYVKSQVHFAVMPRIYDRSVFDYKKAMDYLAGDDRYKFECAQVLRYFYQDMTNMLCKVLTSGIEVDTNISISADLGRATTIPKTSVSMDKIVGELDAVLRGDSVDDNAYSPGVFSKFMYADLDKLKSGKPLALASIFLYYGTSNDMTYVVEVTK